MPPKTFASGAALRTGPFIACKSVSMAVLVFQVHFYTVLVLEKKRNLAPKVHKNTPLTPKSRLAVDIDIHGYIHGYIHVWISDFSHPMDISMDIVLSHLLIKLNI